eukprot:GHVQ01029891.1.p2 GENE.GHVQ01029891.1~~GHVQ01029891.1.p2  ORF type:complete len:130 (-),score=3.55 GHVQ01029891.1:222-611(-)
MLSNTAKLVLLVNGFPKTPCVVVGALPPAALFEIIKYRDFSPCGTSFGHRRWPLRRVVQWNNRISLRHFRGISSLGSPASEFSPCGTSFGHRRWPLRRVVHSSLGCAVFFISVVAPVYGVDDDDSSNTD